MEMVYGSLLESMHAMNPDDNGATWTVSGTYAGIGTTCEFAQFLNNGAGGFIIGCAAGDVDKILISNSGGWSSVMNASNSIFATGNNIGGLTISEELEIIVIGNDGTEVIYLTDDGDETYTFALCTLTDEPTSGATYGGAYGHVCGKFIISTGAADSEYYESTDGKALTLKNDMSAYVETNGAYSPTLDMFVFGHSGGASTEQMLYREENTFTNMAINESDYYSFSRNTDARIWSFEDDMAYDIGRYHIFGVNYNPKLVISDDVVQHTVPLIHGYMTTANRDALVVSEGTSIWNTTTKALNVYNGTGWYVVDMTAA